MPRTLNSGSLSLAFPLPGRLRILLRLLNISNGGVHRPRNRRND